MESSRAKEILQSTADGGRRLGGQQQQQRGGSDNSSGQTGTQMMGTQSINQSWSGAITTGTQKDRERGEFKGRDVLLNRVDISVQGATHQFIQRGGNCLEM